MFTFNSFGTDRHSGPCPKTRRVPAGHPEGRYAREEGRSRSGGRLRSVAPRNPLHGRGFQASPRGKTCPPVEQGGHEGVRWKLLRKVSMLSSQQGGTSLQGPHRNLDSEIQGSATREGRPEYEGSKQEKEPEECEKSESKSPPLLEESAAPNLTTRSSSRTTQKRFRLSPSCASTLG